MAYLKRAADGIDRIIDAMLLSLLFVMCVTLALQVLFRYVFNSPLIWSEEVARYLFVWITMLGAGYGVKRHLHIEMGIFFNKFPTAVKKSVQLLQNFAVILSYAYILPGAVEFTKIQHPIFATTFDMPLSFLFAAAPVGCSLLIFFLVFDSVQVVVDPNRFSQ